MQQLTGSIHSSFDRFAKVACVLLSKPRTGNAQILCVQLYKYIINLNELLIEFDFCKSFKIKKIQILPKIQKLIYSYIKLLKLFNIVRQHELKVQSLKKKELKQARLLVFYLLRIADKVNNEINHN